MKQALLFLAALMIVLSCASATVPLAASPVIVHKPLLVIPGEQVVVPVYNGGRALWSDLSVGVADGPLSTYHGLLGSGEFADVSVTIPLIYLLEASELPVSLYYRSTLLDTRVLPVVVVWPKQAVVADLSAPGGPELVVLMDASQFGRTLGGVQVEVSLLKNDEEVFFDFYGPFYLAPQELFVWRTPLPERYLAPGTYTVNALFYERDEFFAETITEFTYGGPVKVSFGPILLLLFAVLLLVLIYLVVDMIYHGREFSESWSRLRE